MNCQTRERFDLERENIKSASGKKERQVGPEVLRCLSMMMVIIMHFLLEGGVLDLCETDMSETTAVAWILEAFSAAAVNIYILISGYFLYESHFKIKRLIRLVIQVWFYSFAIGILCIKLGLVEQGDSELFLKLLFPITNRHYWFVTEYIKLYLILPCVGIAVHKMTEQTLKRILIMYFILFCLFKSLFPFHMADDRKGYDWLWFVFIFFIAAYIKKRGINCFFKNKIQAFAVYVVCSIAIFFLSMGMGEMVKKGFLTDSILLFMDYNHLLVLLAGLGLFSVFIQTERKMGGIGKVCRKIGKYTLGVYLLHENIGMRTIWPYFFGAEKISSPFGLVTRLAVAVLVVFTAGILLEAIRSFLEKEIFNVLRRISMFQKLDHKLDEWEAGFSKLS